MDQVTELNDIGEENEHLEGVILQFLPSLVREQGQAKWDHDVADHSEAIVELGCDLEPVLWTLLPTHKDEQIDQQGLDPLAHHKWQELAHV